MLTLSVAQRLRTHLLVRDLQQFQDHTVCSHVPEEPLLLFLILLARDALQDTQLAQSQQDLHTHKHNNTFKHTTYLTSKLYKQKTH